MIPTCVEINRNESEVLKLKENKWKNPRESINIDDDPENENWIKQKWPEDWPTNYKEFKEFLNKIAMTPEEFKETQRYKNSVDKPGMEWLKEL